MTQPPAWDPAAAQAYGATTPPYPPQKSGGKGWKIAIVVVAAVLALCCCGGVIGAFFIGKNAFKDIVPARAAAEAFLTDLQEGDTAGAYGRLCSETQGRFSREKFEQGIAGAPKIKSHKLAGVNVNTTNGEKNATVTAKLTYDNGFTDNHTLRLVPQGDTWKVCGDPY